MLQYLVLLVSYLNSALGYISGIRTTINQYPHTVLVFSTKDDEGRYWHFATGSVLNQKIVLTAASDMFQREDIKNKKQNFFVRTGMTNSTHQVTSRNEEGIRTLVSKVVFHKCYNNNTREHNIALLILKSDIAFSTNVKRVAISKKYPANVKKAIVTGWRGFRNATPADAYLFKYKELKVLDQEDCIYQLKGSVRPWKPGFLCATDRLSGLPRDDAEYGSYGMPLVINGYHQIGLSSFIQKGHLDLIVFTNVSHYYNWIVKVAKEHFCEI